MTLVPGMMMMMMDHFCRDVDVLAVAVARPSKASGSLQDNTNLFLELLLLLLPLLAAVAHRALPCVGVGVAWSAATMAVVRREGDGEDVLRVADEPTRRLARRELPESERAVPGARQRELAVARDDARTPRASRAPGACSSYGLFSPCAPSMPRSSAP